ncbi:MAG TPA: sugar phosphate nucleotidyltransferase [Usitatibacter sp.]|nr:sugar phosphate nucleotidyltransferase [Usitatibacter sp.]
MDALILAGGAGTRLASIVGDRAKPVAEVAGRPFLAHVLAQLERCAAIERVTLCVGHRAESVERALGERFGRLPLRYSREEKPLGTGGAIRRALGSDRVRSASLAMNGDSFLGIRIERLLAHHRAARPWLTVALARVDDGSRFGAAQLAGDRVVGFREKGLAGPAWINAGIYVLSGEAKRALREAPRRFSFERDALAPWCAEGRVRGMKSRARFIDIGTPEDYARAASVLARGRAC